MFAQAISSTRTNQTMIVTKRPPYLVRSAELRSPGMNVNRPLR